MQSAPTVNGRSGPNKISNGVNMTNVLRSSARVGGTLTLNNED